MGLVVHQIEFKVRKLRVQPSTPPLQPYLYIWQKVKNFNCQVTLLSHLSHLIKSKAPAFEASDDERVLWHIFKNLHFQTDSFL